MFWAYHEDVVANWPSVFASAARFLMEIFIKRFSDTLSATERVLRSIGKNKSNQFIVYWATATRLRSSLTLSPRHCSHWSLAKSFPSLFRAPPNRLFRIAAHFDRSPNSSDSRLTWWFRRWLACHWPNRNHQTMRSSRICRTNRKRDRRDAAARPPILRCIFRPSAGSSCPNLSAPKWWLCLFGFSTNIRPPSIAFCCRLCWCNRAWKSNTGDATKWPKMVNANCPNGYPQHQE